MGLVGASAVRLRRRRPLPRLRWLLIAPAIVAAVSPAEALDPARSLTQYVHNVWRTTEGLPQNTVTAIVQTPDGYLWLGTREGLVRFDGVRFAIFAADTTPELAQSQILTLFVDGQGRLWIGTWGGGLVRLEDGRFTRLSTADGLPGDLITAIADDPRGGLWIGTDGGGLARLHEGRVTRVPSRDALGLQVRAIVADASGVWVGTDNGLARLGHDGTLTSYGPEQGLSRLSVRALLRDRDGLLWIGTDLGLNQFHDGQFRAFTTRDGLSSNVIVSLRQDRDGSIWVGTDGGGLNRWRDGRFSAFTSRDGLSNDSVLSLHEDREGSLWIGTNLGGVNRLRDGRVTPLTVRDGLSHNYIRAIYEDPQGVLWIGTEGGGLNRIANGEISTFTTRNGLSNDTVFALLQDRGGSLWIGTDSGLTRFRDGRFDIFTADMGLSNDSVLALFEDRAGALWIGTYAGGLNRYSDGRFTAFTTKEGLAHDTVNVILEDRQGTLWIGTRGGGLSRYRDGRFETITTKDGLSDDLVFALHEDREGSLWIGTYGGGLNRLRDGRFAHVSRRHGLFDDVIHRIIDDGRGSVWMSSNRGIFRVAKRDLDEVADGRRATLTSQVFGVADGMRNAECNGGASAGTLTRDRRVWFPTVEGAAMIDPGRLQLNGLAPPVVIERALVDDRPVATAGEFSVPPAAQTLAIHFTALSLVVPEAVRFRYRLEGLEETWIEAETRRTAYYSKLPPGNYRFQVIAANNDGVWNEEGATLAFAVLPRFYETLWFRGLVLLIVALAGPLFYRARIARLTRQTADLERMVAERTADLNAANERLAQLAREDGLTGLLNRRAFDAVLEDECRRAARAGTPLSLLLLDIDAFKAYNDHYGHPAGDACLRAVAGAVRSSHRRAGEAAARYGGEELAVILPGVAAADAATLGESVRQAVHNLAIPHAESTAAASVTVSVGVASLAPGQPADPAALVAAADAALYEAKQQGRNRVVSARRPH